MYSCMYASAAYEIIFPRARDTFKWNVCMYVCMYVCMRQPRMKQHAHTHTNTHTKNTHA